MTAAIMPLPAKQPVVQLEFEPEIGPNRELLVKVVNQDTREVLMCESLKNTAQWLRALGYSYVTGTRAIWASRRK